MSLSEFHCRRRRRRHLRESAAGKERFCKERVDPHLGEGSRVGYAKTMTTTVWLAPRPRPPGARGRAGRRRCASRAGSSAPSRAGGAVAAQQMVASHRPQCLAPRLLAPLRRSSRFGGDSSGLVTALLYRKRERARHALARAGRLERPGLARVCVQCGIRLVGCGQAGRQRAGGRAGRRERAQAAHTPASDGGGALTFAALSHTNSITCRPAVPLALL